MHHSWCAQEKLRNAGKNGGDLIRDMRRRLTNLSEELDARSKTMEAEAGPRSSVLAMEETEKFKPAAPDPTPAQREEGERDLDEVAANRAQATGRPKEVVREEIAEKTRAKKWRLSSRRSWKARFSGPTGSASKSG